MLFYSFCMLCLCQVFQCMTDFIRIFYNTFLHREEQKVKKIKDHVNDVNTMTNYLT